MLPSYFEDIREILSHFGRIEKPAQELHSEFFKTRSEVSPDLFVNSRRFSTAITSNLNPANKMLFGAEAEVRWYHRQRSIISHRDNRCIAVFFWRRAENARSYAGIRPVRRQQGLHY